MRRLLFTLVSAVSLMLCIGIAVLWITAPRWELEKRRSDTIYKVEWAGRLQLEANTDPVEQTGYQLTWIPVATKEFAVIGHSNEMEKWLASCSYRERRFGRAEWSYGLETVDIQTVHSEGHVAVWDFGVKRRLVVPPEVLVVAFAILPLLWIIFRKRRRAVPGLCAKCGYDLRASPIRCPECGTALDSPCKQGG